MRKGALKEIFDTEISLYCQYLVKNNLIVERGNI